MHSEVRLTIKPTKLHSTARTGPRLDKTVTLTYSLTMPQDSRGETKVSGSFLFELTVEDEYSCTLFCEVMGGWVGLIWL